MYILEVSYGCPSDKYPLNGIFQLDQAKALAAYGHKAFFVAVDMRSIRKRRKFGFSTHNVAGLPVYEFNFPLGPIFPKIRKKIAALGFSRLLKKICRERGKPDLVHVHFGDTAQCVIRACKNTGIPYVVTEHSSGINRSHLPRNEVDSLSYIYGNAAAVIAVSKPLADRIYGYTGIHAAVIPNIVDTTLFIGKKSNGNNNGFTFVSAGVLDHRKGFDLLLTAFARMITNYANCRLIIMGSGPASASLQEMAVTLHIQNRVDFTGMYSRSEFAERLCASKAFVLASRRETFGVVYIEAMACGIPVIATACGGPEDFVNEDNGILVPVDDVDALAVAMIKMIESADSYNGNEIAAFVENNFSPAAIAKQLTEVFEVVLREK